jgi:hypothetical protein
MYRQSSREYNGVSAIINKKKNSSIDFKDRFKGKTSMMAKDGHLGVVSNTN